MMFLLHDAKSIKGLMKRLFTACIVCFLMTISILAANYEVSSPNGKVKVMVTAKDGATTV